MSVRPSHMEVRGSRCRGASGLPTGHVRRWLPEALGSPGRHAMVYFVASTIGPRRGDERADDPLGAAVGVAVGGVDEVAPPDAPPHALEAGLVGRRPSPSRRRRSWCRGPARTAEAERAERRSRRVWSWRAAYLPPRRAGAEMDAGRAARPVAHERAKKRRGFRRRALGEAGGLEARAATRRRRARRRRPLRQAGTVRGGALPTSVHGSVVARSGQASRGGAPTGAPGAPCGHEEVAAEAGRGGAAAGRRPRTSTSTERAGGATSTRRR